MVDNETGVHFNSPRISRTLGDFGVDQLDDILQCGRIVLSELQPRIFPKFSIAARRGMQILTPYYLQEKFNVVLQKLRFVKQVPDEVVN